MDCPKHLTLCKCNGIHLEKVNELFYKSSAGYYSKESGQWFFVPFEKSFAEQDLLDISGVLKILNNDKLEDG